MKRKSNIFKGELNQKSMKDLKKLNLGCGKDIKNDFINLDSVTLPGVNIVHDLNKFPWPFKEETFEYILCSQVLEHLQDKIIPLEEIWRISKNGARIKIAVPAFPGIYAVCDPTHKQFFNYSTFDYFDPKNKGLNYYSKSRFLVAKKTIRFHKILKPFELVNFFKLTQKIWAAFFSFLIPATILEFELIAIKNENKRFRKNIHNPLCKIKG